MLMELYNLIHNISFLLVIAVYEGDVYKTMIEAIPKLLNWIMLFRDSQVPNFIYVKKQEPFFFYTFCTDFFHTLMLINCVGPYES